MAKLTRLQLAADIINNVFTNTLRLIKGNTEQTRLINLKDSAVNLLDDANVSGGYLAIDNTGKVDVSFIKSASPTGIKFLADNGTWMFITAGANYGVASGTNTYSINIPGISAYYDGLELSINCTNGNTGACTFNVNGIGILTGVKFGNDALETNDIKNGQVIKGTVVGSTLQITGVTDNIGEGN